MDDAREFLDWFDTTWLRAEEALHGGDAGPRFETWSTAEPVTLYGAWFNATNVDEAHAVFRTLERSMSDFVDEQIDLIAYGVSGDLAYTVHREHTRTTVRGEVSDYVLRTTQVYRREGDAWKVVHRHADRDPSPPAGLDP
ncbi:MAG: nuclear transport factor 2 family protein [Nocardioides sp.]